jgi:hypothetical protein
MIGAISSHPTRKKYEALNPKQYLILKHVLSEAEGA